ncbi:MAG: phosphate acetyltransferase [Candidatus Nanoarchaeia archaeon]
MGLFKRKKEDNNKNILEVIRERAKANPRRIVYPESEDERILRAAEIVTKTKHAAEIILLGDPEVINYKAKELKLNLSKVKIVNPLDDENKEKLEDYAKKLYELRKEKGMTLEEARGLITKPEYYGTMMVYLGEADGLVSGATHTTADTLRPALQIIKTKETVKYASSFFLMVTPDSVFFFADCGFIEEPTEEQLTSIAIQTADSAKRFGFTPKIAMLSFSTKGSGKGAVIEKVRKATENVKKLRPDLIIDGEMQLDAAIVPSVAKLKCPNSPIQGDANVLIFPDLNSGNIGYKLVERFGHTKAIGPIVQGLKKPVNDLSRGCSVEDVVIVTEVTVVEAQDN